VNQLDYVVLIATILAIPLYGLWRTRGRETLGHYIKGDESIRWATIGLSVLATQAGPITFLSMPGQAYESGIGFVQNYFGQPFALITVCAVFVPIFQRLKVYTAYEYLGQRFDQKTRLLGAFLFLIQRGLAAGITIYAPAIILSALLGWRLNLTIWLAGGLVVAYTAFGGTKIVSITQRYQILIIFVGMALAFVIAVHRLPAGLSFGRALTVAGGMGKLRAVDFGNLWRIFSGTLVFRRRPVSGSTVSRRRVVNRQPIRSSFQCSCESADAISHSAAGSNGFPVLPVRRAAYLFQSPSL